MQTRLPQFCFVVPICLAPAILALGWAQRKARKLGYLQDVVAPWKNGRVKDVSREVFWQTDLLGLLLMVAAYSLILIPMTIARTPGNSWSDPEIPALMVSGGVLIGIFVWWELRYARHPILPFRQLKQRTLICCFLIALVHPASGAIQGNYL